MTDSPNRQRIGILGGTFDPIHIGHLLIAEQAREHLQLDQIRFIPAAQAPHKQHLQPTAAQQRWQMVQLAIGGNACFTADDRELRRGGTSYTVDTLAELRQELPDASLFFLIGADSLEELHTWREPAKICEMAFIAVLARGGHQPPNMQLLSPYLPPGQREQAAEHLIPMPQIEISSSHIRANIATGKSVRYQLHPAVEAYISTQGLYRA
jgi:nicotinate-nucleotide adenylyltransferase